MERLQQQLNRIDGKGYPAYKDLRGSYDFSGFKLVIDHVQGDPFAAPSRLYIQIPQQTSQWPSSLFSNQSRRIGLADFIAGEFAHELKQTDRVGGSGGSGRLSIDAGQQEIIPRTACTVSANGDLEIRFSAGLPAHGRRIDGRSATKMLLRQIPEIVKETLIAKNADLETAKLWCDTNEDQDFLRNNLKEKNLIAFIANGAILPRESGASERPANGPEIVPFQSPPSLAVELDTPNRGKIKGMGLQSGIHLIVGGGFHGKSTLMQAIEKSIYNHIPGDGREYVVTEANAFKIKAEDGRSVSEVDISSFINNLPGKTQTEKFSTPNASGSTSQAANIVEAIEAGAQTLLFDEDTCATNFMIRDRRMQALVSGDNEPITPLIDQIKSMSEQGLSLILVMGGCGDYLEVADTVIAMNEYRASEITQEVEKVINAFPSNRLKEASKPVGYSQRTVTPESFPNGRKGTPKVKVRSLHTIAYEHTDIELSGLEQLVDASQTRMLAQVLKYLNKTKKRQSLQELLQHLNQFLETNDLDRLDNRKHNDLAYVRPLEIAAALNRFRLLQAEI